MIDISTRKLLKGQGMAGELTLNFPFLVSAKWSLRFQGPFSKGKHGNLSFFKENRGKEDMSLEAFIASSEYINWRHPLVAAVSHNLTVGTANATDIARRCFEFVRDEIRLSWGNFTYRASDVLEYGTGCCYAKSHLLAALLRANAIPAALCYQRLSRVHSDRTYCLHGLNAVWLEEFGWYRIDASGNKSGIIAQICPSVEQLSLPVKLDAGDLPRLYVEPLAAVVQVFTTCQSA